MAMTEKEKATILRKQEHHQETLAVVRTHFSTVSRLLLKGLQAINSVTGLHTEVDGDVHSGTL
jgi:predicted hydrolase (HD superfamily)